MGNGGKLFLFGTTLSLIILTVVFTLNFSFAKAKSVQFEISDCSVQRNSTYEKSGSCPGPGSAPDLSRGPESSFAESSPKVSSISEEDKTKPAPKISSLEAADQAAPSPKVSSISEEDKTKPTPKISSLEAADQAAPSPEVSSISEEDKTKPTPKISSLEAADQSEPSPKVSNTLNKGIENGVGEESNGNNIKYNFDDLHISGPDQEADNNPEMKAIPPPVQKVVEPIDPFGSVTK